MRIPEIAPSILSADFTNLGLEIKKIEETGVRWLHLDVMDGHFVPNLTFGPMIVEQVRSITSLKLDVHLMIDNPELWIDRYSEAGADVITVHREASSHIHGLVQRIKKLGKVAGVSINPGTSVHEIEYILPDVDLVLIMSVNPGFGGQEFIPSVLEKIKILNAMRIERELGFMIEVDGGVNSENAGILVDLGVDVLVAGSYIFGSQDYGEAVKSLLRKQ